VSVRSVVVVGGGLAGLRACEGLRARGFDGELILLGEEAEAPYDRPPLSKQFLSGDWGLDRLSLSTPEKLAALGLDLRLGPEWRATAFSAASRQVSCEGGEVVRGDGVILATGAHARRLPALDGLPGVFVLRTLQDSTSLRQALLGGGRLGLVGAGFIGLEVAATARKLGVEVTVVEPLEVPLGRVLGRVGGGACEHMHREEGVKFHLGTSISSMDHGKDDSAMTCHLADGTSFEVDHLLVGIGAVPSVRWLEGSGLDAGPSGVTVDENLVAAPGVAVAGDLARWPMAERDGAATLVRVEHRTNAAEQGEWAADGLLRSLGVAVPEPTEGPREHTYQVPYVWSDQYDVKMQIIGLPSPDDDVVVVEGDVGERRFVALYSREGRLTACLGYSRPRHVMSMRSLLASHASLQEAKAKF
jgi:3-phenylpropionate/trans-cinnamate dioxygenase ferredoxin reductase subunit